MLKGGKGAGDNGEKIIPKLVTTCRNYGGRLDLTISRPRDPFFKGVKWDVW